jgi:hypothetical protein
MKVPIAVLPALLLQAGSTPTSPADGTPFILECQSAFTAELDEAELIDRFRAENVVSQEIDVGEGFEEVGTVLFPTSAAERVEILWKNPDTKRMPRAVRIRGRTSRWHTSLGLTLGMTLRDVERLNRVPFRLLGFAWDYEGTVMSWGPGTLGERSPGACRVGARLRPDKDVWDAPSSRLLSQVSGDREFSSGHPAMQELNPTVYEIWLQFR